MGSSASDDQNPPSRGASRPADEERQSDTINLLERAKVGDDQALDELCSRYIPQLQRWAAGRISPIMRRLVDTSDLVQEVLLGTIRRLDYLEPRHPRFFPAYLRRALLNRIYTETQKATRRLEQTAADDNVPDLGPSPLDLVIGQDQRERYESAMNRLNEEEQTAIFLRIELRIAYAEIASVLNKPSTDAARMAVKRAIGRLGEELGHEL